MKKTVDLTKCVECKGHKEGYMSYYCESCYRKILSEEIRKGDKK